MSSPEAGTASHKHDVISGGWGTREVSYSGAPFPELSKYLTRRLLRPTGWHRCIRGCWALQRCNANAAAAIAIAYIHTCFMWTRYRYPVKNRLVFSIMTAASLLRSVPRATLDFGPKMSHAARRPAVGRKGETYQSSTAADLRAFPAL